MRLPIVTVSVLAVTAAVTGGQLADPHVLEALRRSPEALARGEWWRIVTPLLVHADGWRQIVFNFVAIAVVGTMVERLYGRWRWLLFYFVGGLAGEAAGYAFEPYGAGASVAGAGLLGAMAVWLVRRNRPIQARAGGWLLLAGAALLCALRDVHGVPVLAGALCAITTLNYGRD